VTTRLKGGDGEMIMSTEMLGSEKFQQAFEVFKTKYLEAHIRVAPEGKVDVFTNEHHDTFDDQEDAIPFLLGELRNFHVFRKQIQDEVTVVRAASKNYAMEFAENHQHELEWTITCELVPHKITSALTDSEFEAEKAENWRKQRETKMEKPLKLRKIQHDILNHVRRGCRSISEIDLWVRAGSPINYSRRFIRMETLDLIDLGLIERVKGFGLRCK
jgi:hypothetical protein